MRGGSDGRGPHRYHNKPPIEVMPSALRALLSAQPLPSPPPPQPKAAAVSRPSALDHHPHSGRKDDAGAQARSRVSLPDVSSALNVLRPPRKQQQQEQEQRPQQHEGKANSARGSASRPNGPVTLAPIVRGSSTTTANNTVQNTAVINDTRGARGPAEDSKKTSPAEPPGALFTIQKVNGVNRDPGDNNEDAEEIVVSTSSQIATTKQAANGGGVVVTQITTTPPPPPSTMTMPTRTAASSIEALLQQFLREAQHATFAATTTTISPTPNSGQSLLSQQEIKKDGTAPRSVNFAPTKPSLPAAGGGRAADLSDDRDHHGHHQDVIQKYRDAFVNLFQLSSSSPTIDQDQNQADGDDAAYPSSHHHSATHTPKASSSSQHASLHKRNMLLRQGTVNNNNNNNENGLNNVSASSFMSLQTESGTNLQQLLSQGNLTSFSAGGGSDGATESVATEFVSKLTMRCLSPASTAEMPVFMPWEGFAAVLFVDISGYSKLTAALAPLGAHVLSEVVGGYMQRILTTVHECGGDVLKFAGDAVMVAWADEPTCEEEEDDAAISGGAHNHHHASSIGSDKRRGSASFDGLTINTNQTDTHHHRPHSSSSFHLRQRYERRNCVRAAACALALLESCATHHVACVNMTLRLHIGVVAGTLQSQVLAQSSNAHMPRAFHFVGGNIFRSIGNVVDSAQAGELCVNHRVADILTGTDTSRAAAGSTTTKLQEGPKASEHTLSYRKVRCRFTLRPATDPLALHFQIVPGSFDSVRFNGGGRSRRRSSSRSLSGTGNGEDSDFQSSGSRNSDVSSSSSEDDDAFDTAEAFDMDGDELVAPRRVFEKASPFFVHPSLLSRLSTLTQFTDVAEMRFLAILFIHMGDHGDFTVGDWFLEVSRFLEKHSCPAVQLIEDDKGVHIVAAVNLYAAVEDAADVAVRVAIEISEQELDASIGIAAGSTFCGVIGHNGTFRWDITGEHVVRACRLMQHAGTNSEGHRCVLDSTIYSNLVNRSLVAELTPITVKGEAAPVKVYGLAHKGAQASWMVVSEGHWCPAVHSAERRFIEEQMILPAAVVTGACVISGPVESGKMVLAISAVSQRAVEVVIHRCKPHEGIAAVASTLSQWFSVALSPLTRDTASRLKAAIARSQTGRIIKLLHQLVLLYTSSGARFALVIKHAQFLDTLTLSFIQHIVELSSPQRMRLELTKLRSRLEGIFAASVRRRASIGAATPSATQHAAQEIKAEIDAIGKTEISREAKFLFFLTVHPTYGFMSPSAVLTALQPNAFGRSRTPVRSPAKPASPTTTAFAAAAAATAPATCTVHGKALHVRIGALGVEDAGTLVNHRIGWRCDPTLRDLILLKSAHIAGYIDATVQMIQAQRPYITQVSRQGTVSVWPASSLRIVNMPWIAVSPTLTTTVLQSYDILPSKHRAVLRSIAALTPRLGEPIPLETVLAITQKAFRKVEVGFTALLNKLRGLMLIIIKDEGLDACAALGVNDSSLASYEPALSLKTVRIATPALHDALRATLIPTFVADVNRSAIKQMVQRRGEVSREFEKIRKITSDEVRAAFVHADLLWQCFIGKAQVACGRGRDAYSTFNDIFAALEQQQQQVASGIRGGGVRALSAAATEAPVTEALLNAVVSDTSRAALSRLHSKTLLPQLRLEVFQGRWAAHVASLGGAGTTADFQPLLTAWNKQNPPPAFPFIPMCVVLAKNYVAPLALGPAAASLMEIGLELRRMFVAVAQLEAGHAMSAEEETGPVKKGIVANSNGGSGGSLSPAASSLPSTTAQQRRAVEVPLAEYGRAVDDQRLTQTRYDAMMGRPHHKNQKGDTTSTLSGVDGSSLSASGTGLCEQMCVLVGEYEQTLRALAAAVGFAGPLFDEDALLAERTWMLALCVRPDSAEDVCTRIEAFLEHTRGLVTKRAAFVKAAVCGYGFDGMENAAPKRDAPATSEVRLVSSPRARVALIARLPAVSRILTADIHSISATVMEMAQCEGSYRCAIRVLSMLRALRHLLLLGRRPRRLGEPVAAATRASVTSINSNAPRPDAVANDSVGDSGVDSPTAAVPRVILSTGSSAIASPVLDSARGANDTPIAVATNKKNTNNARMASSGGSASVSFSASGAADVDPFSTSKQQQNHNANDDNEDNDDDDDVEDRQPVDENGDTVLDFDGHGDGGGGGNNGSSGNFASRGHSGYDDDGGAAAAAHLAARKIDAIHNALLIIAHGGWVPSHQRHSLENIRGACLGGGGETFEGFAALIWAHVAPLLATYCPQLAV